MFLRCNKLNCVCVGGGGVGLDTQMRFCVNIYMFVHVCMYMSTDVYIYVCMYVYIICKCIKKMWEKKNKKKM